MLRMDGFEVHSPATPQEAVELFLRLPGAAWLAGGTDLLPNLKHRVVQHRNLVNIAGVVPRGWVREGGVWVIGAGTSLSRLTAFEALPALAQAAGLVASPQIRNMGTLGGNILLDTRCLFVNQTEFWRGALGGCLKAEGGLCHVVNSTRKCVATQSADTVPVLLAAEASIRLLSPRGERTLSMRELYGVDGRTHLRIEHGELLTHVLVPHPGPGHRGTYRKLRRRGAIDFPQLGLAVCGLFEGRVARALDIVVGAVGPQPRWIDGLEPWIGTALDVAAVDAIAERVFKRTRPLESVVGDRRWRRQMARVMTRRALRELLELES